MSLMSESYRSIPASAGEPIAGIHGLRSTAVYPRECGGAVSDEVLRGIPTVYPRECGGAALPLTRSTYSAGLSPRVRGSLDHRRRRRVQARSIPASAGEPLSSLASPAPCAVYPRECGGAHRHSAVYLFSVGLSPRVRGSLGYDARLKRADGSIPASAGEPVTKNRSTDSAPVYPRECGGAACARSASSRMTGLSPRVRGSPCFLCQPIRSSGSIPASAGEPHPRLAPARP